MAYNFKNLADVELLDTMPESANLLVEVDGTTKRAPKEDGIGKLTSVEVLEEVPEGATVLAEVNGEIKRVPGAGLGGGKTPSSSAVKTAIIRDSEYLNAIAGLQTAVSDAPAITYECINMTFEEAYETMANGEPLTAIGMITAEGALVLPGLVGFAGTAMLGAPTILIMLLSTPESITLFWTADGIFMP
jgi:hypothetical protein